MKILIYTDVHWSTYSSIVRKRGDKYSVRLENLIKCVNNAEMFARSQGCDEVVCLGDFFDRPELTSEEITALTEVTWAPIPHRFIVGNHESNVNDLMYSSTQSLHRNGMFEVIDKIKKIELPEVDIYFLPYILEEDRLTISEYVKDSKDKNKPIVIFSHNDIKGIRYGKFESKEGFDIDDIENNCNLFINGHLHNCGFLNDKDTILNLGNLTGQNFGENAFEYPHYICILDTDTLKLDFFENIEALNFYKLVFSDAEDIHDVINTFGKLKKNAVLSIKCEESLLDTVKKVISNKSDIVDYRISVYSNKVNIAEINNVSSSINMQDHLQQFSDYILEKFDYSQIVAEELGYIRGGA